MLVFSRWNTSRVSYQKNIFPFLSLVLNLLAVEKIGGRKGKKRTLFSILIYMLPILNLD